ncbi:unnamed protein product [Parascedosporium putredinis]|uniref:Uncharacterized protein n=1 Tax=Parascedosporium putredinis TaxID=1442378 RepID=A0A9P1GWB6_9PEZI|nr:unnamed protein product [Parascedosporium putredinis]CAI7988631.1 unnamed protein product [Parascedosporium putredinis]
MSIDRILRGACHCGRFGYEVAMPEDLTDADVIFKTDPVHRSTMANPFPSIYVFPSCAYHSEETGDADFIMVTLGSLDTEDLRDLEILGLIPGSDDGEDDENRAAPPGPSASTNDSEEVSATDPAIDNALKILAGIPWFESLVEGSILGRLTQATRARQTEIAVPGGGDTPKLTIQWEITEFHDDDDESDDAGLNTRSGTLFGKRKLREFVDEMEKELGF